MKTDYVAIQNFECKTRRLSDLKSSIEEDKENLQEEIKKASQMEKSLFSDEEKFLEDLLGKVPSRMIDISKSGISFSSHDPDNLYYARHILMLFNRNIYVSASYFKDGYTPDSIHDFPLISLDQKTIFKIIKEVSNKDLLLNLNK